MNYSLSCLFECYVPAVPPPPMDPKIESEFFENLPPELVIDILSRLPIQTIISCKCICKSWLHLINTEEFARFHSSKSIPCLLATSFNNDSVSHRIFDFEESDGPPLIEFSATELHMLHYSPATAWFHLPCHRNAIEASVNGLLLWQDDGCPFICNPITREYIKIPPPDSDCMSKPFVTYALGVSKTTGRHKLLSVSRLKENVHEYVHDVYTLGTGTWRRVDGAGFSVQHDGLYPGPFVLLHGKFHWLSIKSSPCINSLDLETELFCRGCALPLKVALKPSNDFSLGVVRDSLCLCELRRGLIVVWSLKEDELWENEFCIVINLPTYINHNKWLSVNKIVKIFEDGYVLMEWCGIPYFTRWGNIDEWGWLKCWRRVIVHTPSFSSLTSFETEEVISFRF